MDVWIIPLLSAIVWWAWVIAILATWKNAVSDNPRVSRGIIYVNTIAYTYWSLTLTCTIVACILFGAASVFVLYLRSRRRIPASRYTTWISYFSTMLLCVGQLCIILAQVFGYKYRPATYQGFLGASFACVGLHALISIPEFFLLHRDFPQIRNVFASLILRTVWFVVMLVISCVYAAHLGSLNAAAGCQWALVFIYPLYMLIMAWDLWLAHKPTIRYYTFADKQKFANEASDADSMVVEQPQRPGDESPMVLREYASTK